MHDLIERPPLMGTVYYDANGNVFLMIKNMYYWLTVDKYDKLEFVQIDYDSLSTADAKYKKQKIKHIETDSTLKARATQTLIEELEEEHESEEDDNEENLLYKTNLKYYPENKFYYCDEGDVDVDLDSDDDRVFFVSDLSSEQYVKKLDRQFDSFSLYDTLVIDVTKGNSNVVFSLESNEKCAYRITINTNNVFILNVVGSSIKHFTLYFDDDEKPVFK